METFGPYYQEDDQEDQDKFSSNLKEIFPDSEEDDDEDDSQPKKSRRLRNIFKKLSFFGQPETETELSHDEPKRSFKGSLFDIFNQQPELAVAEQEAEITEEQLADNPDTTNPEDREFVSAETPTPENIEETRADPVPEVIQELPPEPEQPEVIPAFTSEPHDRAEQPQIDHLPENEYQQTVNPEASSPDAANTSKEPVAAGAVLANKLKSHQNKKIREEAKKIHRHLEELEKQQEETKKTIENQPVHAKTLIEHVAVPVPTAEQPKFIKKAPEQQITTRPEVPNKKSTAESAPMPKANVEKSSKFAYEAPLATAPEAVHERVTNLESETSHEKTLQEAKRKFASSGDLESIHKRIVNAIEQSANDYKMHQANQDYITAPKQPIWHDPEVKKATIYGAGTALVVVAAVVFVMYLFR